MATITPVHPLPSLDAATTPAELQDRLAAALQTQRTVFASQHAAAVAARAAVSGTEAKPTVVSTEEFTRALTGMQAHYTAAVAAVPLHSTGSALSASPLHFELAAALAFHPVLKTLPAFDDTAAPPPAPHVLPHSGDTAVDALVTHIHTASLALIQQHSNTLVASAKDAQSRKIATAAWLKQVEASRVALKKSVDAELDNIYSKATAIGNEHPEQRARVLAVANQGSSLFHSLFGGVIGVTTAIASAAGGVAHAVSSTVTAVGSWAAGAVKSVGSFFSHLF